MRKDETASAGDCPFCDAENGILSSWGMSDEGWRNMRIVHDNGHVTTKDTTRSAVSKCCDHPSDGSRGFCACPCHDAYRSCEGVNEASGGSTSEAGVQSVKELEEKNAQLLADWRRMKEVLEIAEPYIVDPDEWIGVNNMTFGCGYIRPLSREQKLQKEIESVRKTKADKKKVNDVLRSLSYTDSPSQK